MSALSGYKVELWFVGISGYAVIEAEDSGPAPTRGPRQF